MELRALDPKAFADPEGYWLWTINDLATGY
ncbi:SUKH-4 family immunity protein [Actinoallomurus purpureus]|nr:SUKH-4 family immunity protein [Actinoallomurus purpureus]MCO6008140.1 SUKH-4 family immunity protein [Actinoallomurus purpureus]